MRIYNYHDGYAIVERSAYNKYKTGAYVYRVLNDKEEAYRNKVSMEDCDGIPYAVYDCKNKKLVY